MTPLHIAELCRLLLDFCREICTIRSSKDGNLPLQAAILAQNWNAASILLEETVKYGVLDLSQEDYPLIHLAIENSSGSVPGSAGMKNEGGELPLMNAVQQQIAIPTILRALIEEFPKALRIPDVDGDLPLHNALRGLSSDGDGDDYPASIRLFIDQYADGLSTRNYKGQLPLHVWVNAAAAYASEEEMQVLRLVSERYHAAHMAVDIDGNFPMHMALSYYSTQQKLDVVRFLAEQNEPALRIANSKGHPPLHLVVQQVAPSDDVVRFLVEAFPEGLQSADDIGNLPLQCALMARRSGTTTFHSTEFIRYLIDQSPGAARHANIRGSLPLHLVCSDARASYAFIDLLVLYYAEGLSVFDRDSLLPFHRLCVRDHEDGTLLHKMLQTWFRGRSLPLTADNTQALFFACEKNASLDVIKLLSEKSTDPFQAFANTAKVSNTKHKLHA